MPHVSIFDVEELERQLAISKALRGTPLTDEMATAWRVSPALRSWLAVFPVRRTDFTQEEELVLKLAWKHNMWLMGGYARFAGSVRGATVSVESDPTRKHMANNEPIPAGDIDLFPECESELLNFLRALGKAGLSVREASDFSFRVSDRINVIKHNVGHHHLSTNDGNPLSLMQNFDFDVTRAWLRYTVKDEELVFTDIIAWNNCFQQDYVGQCSMIVCFDPLYEMERLLKYSAKGFMADRTSITMVLEKWHHLQESERELKRQYARENPRIHNRIGSL